MTGLNSISQPLQHAAHEARMRQLTHQSSARENVFEHMLLGQIGGELLARGVDYDELHSSVDKDGFDVLLEAGDIQRYIQLKVMTRGGRRSDVTIHRRLALRPSGCVIWLTHDPVTRSFCDIRWFGGAPGKPLPDLGDRAARHSRANALGVKTERPDHRVVPARRFARLEDIAQLVDILFGRLPAEPLAFLRSRLSRDVPASPAWLAHVADGNLAAIPASIDWNDGVALAGLVDGYRLLELFGAGEPKTFLDQQRAAYHSTGVWPGDAERLWATAFLEARAERFGSNDGGHATPHLDQLIRQLREALVELEAVHA